MLLAYPLGVADHYGCDTTPSIFAFTLMPALLWFMSSWAVAVGQLSGGASIRRPAVCSRSLRRAATWMRMLSEPRHASHPLLRHMDDRGTIM